MKRLLKKHIKQTAAMVLASILLLNSTTAVYAIMEDGNPIYFDDCIADLDNYNSEDGEITAELVLAMAPYLFLGWEYSLLDVIEWMYEKDDLTESQKEDLDLAMAYYEKKTISYAAISLYNQLYAASALVWLDNARKTDENYNGYIYTEEPVLMTSFYSMMVSAWTATVSQDSTAGHVSGQYPECLAWGCSPKSWVNGGEKTLYNECKEELGYEGAVTTEQAAEIIALAKSKGYELGHYITVMAGQTACVGLGHINDWVSTGTSSYNTGLRGEYEVNEFYELLYEFIIDTGVCATSGSFDGITWEYDADTRTLTYSGELECDPDDILIYPWQMLLLRTDTIVINSSYVPDRFFCGSTATTIILNGENIVIGYGAFCGDGALTCLVGAENIISVGDLAFYGSGFESLELTLDQESLYETFSSMDSLKEITINGTVTQMECEFKKCDSLEIATITAPIETLENTFYDCPSLKTIYLPGTLKTISGFSFEGTNVEAIYFDGTQEQWEAIDMDDAAAEALQNAEIHFVESNDVSSAAIIYESEVTYTGAEICPEVTVKLNGVYLEEDTDYTAEYSDNTTIGTGTITITGIGEYTGTETVEFAIGCGRLENAEITLSETSIVYHHENSNAGNIPDVTITLDGNVLTEGVDYTLSWESKNSVGTWTVTATGKGNCYGTITAEYEITAQEITDDSSNDTYIDIGMNTASYTYTGEAIEPYITVYVRTPSTSLYIEPDNYTIEYSDNIDVGTASVTVTLSEECGYTGTATKTFVITKPSIKNAEITLEEAEYSYTGEEIEPKPVITYNGITLEEGTDYTLSYTSNIAVGTGYVCVYGKGNFSGSSTIKFKIVKNTESTTTDSDNTETEDDEMSADDANSTETPDEETAGGSESSSEETADSSETTESSESASSSATGADNVSDSCKNGHTYVSQITKEATCTANGTITYTCSVCGDSYSETIAASGHAYDAGTTEAPTCTDIGFTVYTCTVCGYRHTTNYIDATGHNYSGNVCTECGEVKNNEISQASVTLSSNSYTYDGTAKKPSVTVIINGTTLTKDVDYTVSYSDNTNAGTATVTITGKGSYSGITTVDFTIKAKSISTATVTLSSASYTYDGSTKKPTIKSVVLNGTTLSSSDYTVKYASGRKNIGIYNVKVTGTGNYTGTATVTFTIKPAKVTINSIASSAAKSLTVKWSKVSGSVTGYQIRYKKSTSSTWTTVTVKASTLNKTISSLTAGKKYNVQVRAYKTVDGTKYYGSWSSTKSVTVKKAQTLTVKSSSSKSVSYSKVKKAKQTVSVITKVSGAKGAVTYSKSSGKSYFTVNSKTGKITVKKGTPKGTYTVKIKVSSAATSTYAKTSKTITVKIKVK